MDYASLLNEDKGLFEEEFSSLIDDFPFEDYEEIHDFFSENRGLIVILKKTRPLLEKHVPYASFHLELDVDPLVTPQLLLVVKALDYDFNNGFKDYIKFIDSELDDLLLKLNLSRKFFIFDTSCNAAGKSALSLKEVSRHYSGYYNQ
ncbi:hypothetical protein [uncultured Methanobrevibacter sp.]|uniref:hypothetical protein n=1 Tax=uncultured Methanobrevibacter sp. TaxID=253161 RepID=UPI00262F490A|nr:hypothetical protein [uncultured Methanobrevibacter sp.]